MTSLKGGSSLICTQLSFSYFMHCRACSYFVGPALICIVQKNYVSIKLLSTKCGEEL